MWTMPPCFHGSEVISCISCYWLRGYHVFTSLCHGDYSFPTKHGPLLWSCFAKTLAYFTTYKNENINFTLQFARPSTYMNSFSSHSIPVSLSLLFPFKVWLRLSVSVLSSPFQVPSVFCTVIMYIHCVAQFLTLVKFRFSFQEANGAVESPSLVHT